MITLTKISHGGQALGYYAEKDDYYREGGEAPARFAGEGAAALGLTGAMDRASAARFAAVLDGQVAGAQVGQAGRHTPGWDMTFSAPKSTSIAALAAGDDRLVAAHDRAVAAALAHLERHAIVTRQRDDEGRYVWRDGGGMAAAVFRHTTNRNADPQLHSHAVIANLTRDTQTGAWRSLDSRELYAVQAEANALYMNELARGARAAGYTIDWTVNDKGHPSFELREVPVALREAWSSRTAEIDAALAARGTSRETASADEKQIAALDTRERKEVHARAALAEEWRATAHAHGFASDQRPQYALDATARAAAADTAVVRAVEHLGERDARFSQRDLLHEARIASQGRAGDAELAAAVERAQHAGALLQRQAWGRTAGGQRGARAGFTTLSGIRTELALLGTARRLEADGQPLADAAAAARTIAGREVINGRPMSDEQRAAATALLTSTSRLHVLSGHAGTAKTTSVLATVADQARADGIEVRAMAPTSSAAGTLGEALGAKSTTVAAVLHEQEPTRANAREVWIVDEAGMVSARDMRDLLARAEKSDATVILSGDSRQIGSVGAGAAYSQLEASVQPTHRHQLTQIVRQSNEQLRDAVYDAVHGRVRDALRKADTHVIPSRDAQIEAAAARYQQATSAGQSALVVALSRADRSDINKEVHALRVAAGAVRDVRAITVLDSKQWTDAQRADAARFQTGAVIVWGADQKQGPRKGEQTQVLASLDDKVTVQREDGTKWTFSPRTATRFDVFDARKLEVGRGEQLVTRSVMYADGTRLANGTRLEVMGVHSDHLTVRDDKGQHFDIDTQRGLHVDLGYSMTADQAQGKTVDVAIGVMRSGQENLADQSRLYVAISRARAHGVVITDDQQKLVERLQINTGERQTALEHGRAPEAAPQREQEHAAVWSR